MNRNRNTSPMGRSNVAERARLSCRMRLSSAARTAAACAAVGCATLYGPRFLSTHIKFSAFSYLTAVLIVSDATLGDTLRGCWHAFVATAQVVPLAMLGRRFMDPTAGMPAEAAAVAVALAAFLVALPECTHLTAKKLAFGQIVLICSDAVIDDISGDGFTHPLYVAASTALGALASVFALLLPFPGLASHKVQELSRVYAENASQRMKIYVRASNETDKATKMELISQAMILSETGAKLLDSITNLEDGLRWERPWSRVSPGERLQSMEQQMRGIQYALLSSSSSSSTPLQETDQQHLSNTLQTLSTRIEERIEQLRCYSPFRSKIESETRSENPSSHLEPNLPNLNRGWLSLYFSCIDMFLNDAFSHPKKLQTQTDSNPTIITTRFKHWIHKLTRYERLEFALKCSVSLSLAVLLGLTFDKENGCWAGLTIAISFVTGRQAIFTIANSRLQGTAIGSVYGVICCFIFHHEELRLIALLPWIVLASFLRYSKMYGQTGGVSAAIGALVILGRKNYGAPNEFAIARLTEVFIGLSAFILVEIFLQPFRAGTLARNQMHFTLRSLQDCIRGMAQKNQNEITTEFLDLKEKRGNLNYLVSQLKDYVADAEMEPDFWYLPFRASSYKKVIGSLSHIVDMLHFITLNFEKLSNISESDTGSKFKEQINNELQALKESLSSSCIYQEKENTTEAQAIIEEAMEEGKLQNQEKHGVLIKETEETDWAANEEDDEDNANVKERIFKCISATEFCINSVVKELEEIKMCIREIDQW